MIQNLPKDQWMRPSELLPGATRSELVRLGRELSKLASVGFGVEKRVCSSEHGFEYRISSDAAPKPSDETTALVVEALEIAAGMRRGPRIYSARRALLALRARE